MLTLQYSSHCVLPDASTLLAVLETRSERRWFKTVETSETVSYVLRAGYWWGKGGERVQHSDPRHLRLTEIAMRAQIRESVDTAVL